MKTAATMHIAQHVFIEPAHLQYLVKLS